MVMFEDKMRESNTLYREHQRILDISRRLSEQNEYVFLLVTLVYLCSNITSQLLELLHDLNDAPQVPPSHRYDLQPPGAETKESQHEDQTETFLLDANTAPAMLREARQGLKSGRMSMADYHHMEDSIRRSKISKPAKSYLSLLEMPYISLDNAKSYNKAAKTAMNGFPSPREEERYLEGLDSYLNGIATTPRPFTAGATRSGERSSEKDREMALKNPVSVYNWLRKHQPQVFLQDNEAHTEKATTRPATSRSSKRANAVKQEPDLYDEDGIALDEGSSCRGKRKRDDDGGYRPKGGNGRPVKRKKEDGSAKKSKRASISGLS
jgi:IEC3 subunit of the Ino80 complex, chromatin re-modelling